MLTQEQYNEENTDSLLAPRKGGNQDWSRNVMAPSLVFWGGGFARVTLVCLSLFLVGGCSTEQALQPVEGLVTLDGVPVADAAVLFQPLRSDGPPAHGTTDEQGKFILTTNNHPGVKVGTYRVAVSKVEMPNLNQASQATDGGERRSGFLEEDQLKEVYLLPKRYVDVMTSALTADVQDNAKNYFTFSLTTDETMGDAGSAASDPSQPLAPSADAPSSESQDISEGNKR